MFGRRRTNPAAVPRKSRAATRPAATTHRRSLPGPWEALPARISAARAPRRRLAPCAASSPPAGAAPLTSSPATTIAGTRTSAPDPANSDTAAPSLELRRAPRAPADRPVLLRPFSDELLRLP
nr:atherin-like [Aegilops tauschii subsp. strangulata]